MTGKRDVALVLSGGGVNGVLLELGFLKRLRESEVWPRVGWIYGTSAGALAGTMAALDRLDDLERFMLDLRPEETFRPNRLWQLPLLGMMDYALPRTVDERLGDTVQLARDLAASEIEIVVLATDLTDDDDDGGGYELAYSSRTTPPDVMAQAVLASAAISALVLPVRVGDRIATDGSWVRNYPLGHAYEHPEVELIVAFRYLPRYPQLDAAWLAVMRRRFERFGRVPPVRAIVEELREAEGRAERGEPAHLPEMIMRLARVAIMRNTTLEERVAGEKDRSIDEFAALRSDVTELVDRHVRNRRDRAALLAAVDERFAEARFPFRHDRLLPRITVRGAAGDVSLDQSFRRPRPWTESDKRELIRRGYELTSEELRSAGYA
jgi:predicted acylesterase/phospholipase RssA